MLRRVLLRNQIEFYNRNKKQIITIQAGLRMFKAMKVCRRLKMLCEQQSRAARRFEKGFESFFRTKPSAKRGDHINKILNDQQSLLLQERVSPALSRDSHLAASRTRYTKGAAGGGQNVHTRTGMNNFLRRLTSGPKAQAKALQTGASRGGTHHMLHFERREKTLQALRYIQ
jgi:hypothetical protein